MRKTILAIGIIFLLIGINVNLSTGNQINTKPINSSVRGNTLYVGGNGTGNYSKIQDAIDNATSGDTVFVYDDSSPYYENITIDKSINLIGEIQSTAIISKKDNINVISVVADEVTISHFTIQSSYQNESPSLINIKSNSVIINDNIIKTNSGDGINLSGVNNIIISNNTIYDISMQGIRIYYSSNIEITHNKIYSGGNCGILTYLVRNLFIHNNYFEHNFFLSADLDLSDTEFIVKRNTFNTNGDGLFLLACNNSIFTENNIMSRNCRITFFYLFPVTPRKSNNKFDSNYWYEPRYLPKLVKGLVLPIKFLYFPKLLYLYLILYSFDLFFFFHIDWHPAKEPYDIGV